jgi:CheY-like chemotaxis protein
MMLLDHTLLPSVILVVEDEMLLRMRAVDMVEDAGYVPIEAVDADDAVQATEVVKERDTGKQPFLRKTAGFRRYGRGNPGDARPCLTSVDPKSLSRHGLHAACPNRYRKEMTGTGQMVVSIVDVEKQP